MPLLRLHLLRHGQTISSRGNLFCGRRLDPPLTEEGLAMAASFAAAYRERRWAGLYSSPLDRAVTTAQPLADAVGMPVQTRDGLAEIDYGAWDGLSAPEVAEQFPIEYARWMGIQRGTRRREAKRPSRWRSASRASSRRSSTLITTAGTS